MVQETHTFKEQIHHKLYKPEGLKLSLLGNFKTCKRAGLLFTSFGQQQ